MTICTGESGQAVQQAVENPTSQLQTPFLRDDLMRSNNDGHYRLNPDVSISAFDTGYREPMYQVVLGSRRFQINELSRSVLNSFAEPRGLDDLARITSGTDNAVRDEASLRRFLRTAVDCKLLVPVGSDSAAIKPEQNAPKTPLLVKYPLFSQQTLLPITKRLQYLFVRPVMILCILLIVVAYLFAALHAGLLTAPVLLTSLTAKEWLLFVLFNYLALMFHELGHSSACARGGASHGHIGCGIYLWYPVFYADVTATWSLRRSDRILVDCGGMYFHLIAGAACYPIWAITHSPSVLLCMYSIAMSVIMNMNPFLKFDGYWLVTDLTGIPRLHASTREFMAWIYKRVAKRDPNLQTPLIFKAKPFARGSVIVYAIITSAFSAWLIVHVLWRVLPGLGTALPHAASSVILAVQHRAVSADAFSAVVRSVFLTLSVWGLLGLFWRMARECWRWSAVKWRSQGDVI